MKHRKQAHMRASLGGSSSLSDGS